MNPYWAGYCSVLVNVNDIAAMGGVPMGMTNVISINDKQTCNDIMEGIKDGVKNLVYQWSEDTYTQILLILHWMFL